MAVKDFETFNTLVVQLRLNVPYQLAEAERRKSGVTKMLKKSSQKAQLLVLIGTWERIAMLAKDLPPEQRRKFFKTAPVKIMWDALAPALEVFGGADHIAPEFKQLAADYNHWLKDDPEGQQYQSATAQQVTALFG